MAAKSSPRVLGLVPRHGDDFYATYLERHGFEVLRAASKEFRVSGDRLLLGEKPVDLIDAPADLFGDDREDTSGIEEALRRGLARPFFGHAFGLVTMLKSLFEVLTDPTHGHMFDDDLRAALLSHVPWTRAVRDRRTDYQGEEIDLIPFVTKHRERFVLKPSAGYSGHGVLLGDETDDATWQKALRQAKVLGDTRRLPTARSPAAARSGGATAARLRLARRAC